MSPIDLDLTAHEHAGRLRAGEYTARALAEAALARELRRTTLADVVSELQSEAA